MTIAKTSKQETKKEKKKGKRRGQLRAIDSSFSIDHVHWGRVAVVLRIRRTKDQGKKKGGVVQIGFSRPDTKGFEKKKKRGKRRKG